MGSLGNSRAIHPPGSKGLDCRPRVFDGISKSWKLCDTGSMVTVVRKTENDKVDDSKMLQAVNGSTIKCYGQKSISVRLGRKTYDVIATVADVDQDILGWDFMSKHKLNIEWDDCGELILRDKKADIRAKLKCIALPSGSIPRTALVAELPVPDEFSSEYFEVAAMKSLPSESTASNHIQAKYLRLIEKYPGIDKPNFNDLSTKHGVTHKIPTHGPPFKAKVRPLMPNTEKAIKGKQAWDEMERLGVVEKVKPNDNTDWVSPLHLTPKGDGSMRPCSDFRKLNEVTTPDGYPMHSLKSFTNNLHGSKVFTVIDLYSAFHNVVIEPCDVKKTTTVTPWGV